MTAFRCLQIKGGHSPGEKPAMAAGLQRWRARQREARRPKARGRCRPSQRRPWSWSRPQAPVASSAHGSLGQRLWAHATRRCRGVSAGTVLAYPLTSPRAPGSGRAPRRQPSGPVAPRCGRVEPCVPPVAPGARTAPHGVRRPPSSGARQGRGCQRASGRASSTAWAAAAAAGRAPAGATGAGGRLHAPRLAGALRRGGARPRRSRAAGGRGPAGRSGGRQSRRW